MSSTIPALHERQIQRCQISQKQLNQFHDAAYS